MESVNQENNEQSDEIKKEPEPHKSSGFFEIFKQSFPWKAILFGFFIPKMIFHYFFISGNPVKGVIIAVIWCLSYLALGFVKDKKLDWFTVMAVFFIFVRMSTFFISQHPTFAVIAGSFDSFLFALLYFGSLLFKKPLVQVFVDAIGIKEIPDFIRKTPYYRSAWVAVTMVWGLINLIQGLIYVWLKVKMPDHPEYFSGFDAVSGWPTTVLMIAFSIQFPKWYWKKYINEIRAFSAEQKEP